MFIIERHIVIGNTDNIAWLDNDGDFSDLNSARIFSSYEDAERHCNPDGDPNNRNSRINELRWEIKSYPYIECPVCGELWSKDDMQWTYDCHGIPYRLVCPDCYDMVMEHGYDGAFYTAMDECIDEDY